MNTALETLTPAPLWRHFDVLCNTPRPSWHEAAIQARIVDWAEARGLACTQDAAGNLLITQPATAGHEAAPTVALQAHVDMVAEAEPHVVHDFTRDAIRPRVVDGWLMATDTTLGADNGIGVAAALAILEDETIEHGPLEVLLTVAEEVSLVGAARLAPDWLSADYLLNLDTEEAGDICIGCAGGANVSLDERCDTAALPDGHRLLAIEISGLAGGHSGMDIHTGRTSANVLMARLLASLSPHAPHLVVLDGGRMDNAITRHTRATIAVPGGDIEAVTDMIARFRASLDDTLVTEDQNLSIRIDTDTTTATSALTATASKTVIDMLAGLPYGVAAMSDQAPGTVETSNNIGVVQLSDGQLTAQLMVRSLVDTERDRLAESIARHLAAHGFSPGVAHGYPGWAPDADSGLLARFQAVHAETTGAPPRVVVLHAGLECGLIGAKYPALEMISFGPTIRGAHSPAERVDIASVETFYRLLGNTLTALAR
ncbi:beta-Ala-His dipeptidase [Salinisphaera japonica]|uniref:Cytosol non-specific dipeptidase n=1 Tax=Salinisphaera japonica YTM-1 TaxID=1209778 RepID=A0A423PTS8_9GAMM|nr:beta-Ala-His dipeptidase [Salinisphaera japonica]ROO28932.1 aminoacyl-histidine dipeptidase [Salinisphaera japonica YTM-1]